MALGSRSESDSDMKENYEGFTPHEQYVLGQAEAGCDPPAPNQCFANAQLLFLANDSGKICYHEGYLVACRKDGDGTEVALPEFPHAWCSINGKVFDPTYVHLTEYDCRYRNLATVSKRRLAEHVRQNGAGEAVTWLPGVYRDGVRLSNGWDLPRKEAQS